MIAGSRPNELGQTWREQQLKKGITTLEAARGAWREAPREQGRDSVREPAEWY